MRCEDCTHKIKEDITDRKYNIRCGLTPRHRKVDMVYISICTYSRKMIYAPRWCPLKKKDGD